VARVASRSISITYVPADCGSMIPGKSKAPEAFRDVGIAARLAEAGVPSVAEHHALEVPAAYAPVAQPPGGVRNEALNVAVCDRVHDALGRNLDGAEPDFQLILGGECCMSPAIVAAFWEHAGSISPERRVGSSTSTPTPTSIHRSTPAPSASSPV
jgi:arginase